MNDTTINLIFLALGSFGTWAGQLIISYLQDKKAKNEKAENVIIEILKDQIAELKLKVDKNEGKIDDLCKQNLDCMQHNIELTVKVKDLQNQLNLHIAKTFIPEKTLNENIAKSGDSGIIK